MIKTNLTALSVKCQKTVKKVLNKIAYLVMFMSEEKPKTDS